jgi:hypothetical protein
VQSGSVSTHCSGGILWAYGLVSLIASKPG